MPKINWIHFFAIFRFVKDLSPDKINVSAFRGEGDLSNLQLNEDVLTELLELPSWIRLTSALCNHVSFRISWTKLKSVPITLVNYHLLLMTLFFVKFFFRFFLFFFSFFSHFFYFFSVIYFQRVMFFLMNILCLFVSLILEFRWGKHNDRNVWIRAQWK